MENSFFFSNLLENFDIFEKQSQRDGKKKKGERNTEKRGRERLTRRKRLLSICGLILQMPAIGFRGPEVRLGLPCE